MAKSENRLGIGPELLFVPAVLWLAGLTCWASGGSDETADQTRLMAQATSQAGQTAPPPDLATDLTPGVDPRASLESGYIVYLTLDDGEVVCGHINSDDFFPRHFRYDWPEKLTPGEVVADLAGYGAGPPFYYLIHVGDRIIEQHKYDSLPDQESRNKANTWAICVPAFLDAAPTLPAIP